MSWGFLQCLVFQAFVSVTSNPNFQFLFFLFQFFSRATLRNLFKGNWSLLKLFRFLPALELKKPLNDWFLNWKQSSVGSSFIYLTVHQAKLLFNFKASKFKASPAQSFKPKISSQIYGYWTPILCVHLSISTIFSKPYRKSRQHTGSASAKER